MRECDDAERSVRLKRIPSTAIAVLASLTLVGTLAATSHASVWGPVPPGVVDPAVLILIVGSAFGGCLAAVGALAFFRRRPSRPAFMAGLPTSIVAAVLLSLFFISRTEFQPGVRATGEEQVETGPTRIGQPLESDWVGPAVRRGGREDEPQLVVPRSDLALMLRRLVAVVAVLGLGALFLGRRRARRAGEEVPGSFGSVERAAAHGAIVMSIEAMLNDPDPRTAIIGAYARLLEKLEANGASRRPYEGPTEHLVRVLRTLHARPAALKTLVRLFEIARFSDHSLTLADREEALSALHDVADDLSVAVGAPAAGSES